MSRLLSIPAALLILATPLQAQEIAVTGGLEIELTSGDDGSSQALIGYVELEAGGFYAGVEATLADDRLLNEIDLYLGLRGEAGRLSYDVSYTRYFYPDDGGDCCGELFLGLGYAVTDRFGMGTEFYYDPENDTGSAYLLADFALTDRWSLAGQYGFYDAGAGNYTEWELGVGYALTDTTAISLTFHDGEEYKPYVALNLTWDFNLFPR